MNKALRKAIVAGNWKMNNDRKAAKELIGELTPMVKDAACEVVLCVPYTNLETALSLCEGTNLHVGAENCHWAKSRRLHRRDLCTDAGRDGRRICHHRSLGAQTVLW